MGSGRRMVAPDARRRSPLAGREALHEALRSEPAECLVGMVHKALALFEAGADPDVAYAGFDIESFAGLLSRDPSGAARALSLFRGRPLEERIAASMFVSMAVIAVDNTDPRLSRLILEELGKGPDSEMPDLVLLGIAQTVHDMGPSCQDPSLFSLAAFCLSRLSH